MLSKWLSKKDIMAMTGVSRYMLDAAINAGNLRFQMMGKRMMFTLKDVEQWQNNTTNHIDCISEGKSTTHIYHSSRKLESVYSLENLLEEQEKTKLQRIASKGLQKFKKNLGFKHPENCPA